MGTTCSSESAIGSDFDPNDPNRFDDLLSELLQQRIAQALGSPASTTIASPSVVSANEVEEGGARYSPKEEGKGKFFAPNRKVSSTATEQKSQVASKLIASSPMSSISDNEKSLQQRQRLLTSIVNQLEGKVSLALEKARRAVEASSSAQSAASLLKSPPNASNGISASPISKAAKSSLSASSNEGAIEVTTKANNNKNGTATKRTSSSTSSTSSQNITSDKNDSNTNQQQLRFANRFQANKGFLEQLRLGVVATTASPQSATGGGQHFNFAGRRAESQTNSYANEQIGNTFQPRMHDELGGNNPPQEGKEAEDDVAPFSTAPSMVLDSTNFGPTNHPTVIVAASPMQVSRAPLGPNVPSVSMVGTANISTSNTFGSATSPRAAGGKQGTTSPRAVPNKGAGNTAHIIQTNDISPADSTTPNISPTAPRRNGPIQQQQSSLEKNSTQTEWMAMSDLKDVSPLVSGSLAMFKSIRRQQQQQEAVVVGSMAGRSTSPADTRLGIHKEFREQEDIIVDNANKETNSPQVNTLSPVLLPLENRVPNPMVKISEAIPNAEVDANALMPNALQGPPPTRTRESQKRFGATAGSGGGSNNKQNGGSKSAAAPHQPSSTVVLSFSKAELMIILGALQLLNTKR